jgi:SAM-dependent methyltransferase
MTNPRDAAAEWPPDGLETVDACPVCGSAGYRVMYEGLRDRLFGAPGTWTLMRCPDCLSAHLNPRPTVEAMELAYRSYYTHVAPTPPPSAGWVRRGLANDYMRARWGYDGPRAITGGRLIAHVARSRAALVDREIRHLPAVPGGRLLDVGCGSGVFMAQMAALGWQTEGIDPDPAAVAHAREAGLRVTQGTLVDLAAEEHSGTFDAVTLSHVIEHLHDPADDLRRINRLLRPGGRLWIGTPNLESLGFRRYGRDWRGLEPPRHTVLFTRASLESLLRETGFEPQPAPPAAPHAFQMLTESAATARRRSGDDVSANGERKVRALATVANWASLRDARNAEELVMIARRPSA